jgi:SAM-dependent methyltransferase
LQPNPHLLSWLNAQPPSAGGRALTIGCGLGDDAEELAQRGWQVSAFDISPTAIEWCRRRFPHSRCEYGATDVLQPPAHWDGDFDLVFEAYTLQVLPPALRRAAMVNVARFVKPGGMLLIVCRGREAGDFEGQMPWPLLRSELEAFKIASGLVENSFEDFFDGENPPVRRFRAVYRKPEIPKPEMSPN